jgi:hypothetical protein
MQQSLLPPRAQEIQGAQQTPDNSAMAALHSLLHQQQQMNHQQQVQQQGQAPPHTPISQNEFLTGALVLLQSALSNLQGLQGLQGQVNTLQQQPQGHQQPSPQVTNGGNAVDNGSLEILRALGLQRLGTLGQGSGQSYGQELSNNDYAPTEETTTGKQEVAGLARERRATVTDSRFEVRIPCRARGMLPDHNFQVGFGLFCVL